MPRVICEISGTSAELDGLAWEATEDGKLLSPDLPEAAAARYASIPGFKAAPEPEQPEKQPEPTVPLRGARGKAAATEPPPADPPAPATDQPKE